MLRAILVSFCITLLTGCASAPTPPAMNFHEGGRIGLYIDVSETIKHKHVGTTIFNNNEKIYPVQWDFANSIQHIVSSSLQKNGYEVVIIPKGSIAVNSESRMIEYQKESWIVPPSGKKLFETLRNDMKLDAMFIFQKGNTLVNLECGSGGCSPHYMDAPGLYSRSMFGLAYYLGSWGFDWYTYSLNPPADLTKTAPYDFHFTQTSTPLSRNPGFEEPKEITELSAEELLNLRKLILQDIEQKTLMLVENMNK